MKKTRGIQLILLVLISLLVGYYLGVNKIRLDWQNYKPSLSVLNKESPSNLASTDFSLFWTVWQKLETNYYDKTKLDPQKMLNGAISGMIGSLGDPYTVYLPKTENNNFKDGLAGRFSGIGAELGLKDKQIIVIAPLDGSPAQKAGIKAGDQIQKVDGASTSGWSLSQAVEKIRGEKGTVVVLTVLHENESKPEDVRITRDIITVKSVDGWVKKIKDIDKIKISENLEDEIVYIRLSQFGDSTNKDWLALVNSLSLQISQSKNVKGLVLDLRSNPGGYLDDAVFIASEFLKQKTPVVIQDNGFEKKTKTVQRQGIFIDDSKYPLVILIDKGSASASEIVSGALQDNKRAELVGETSFGKGTIQQAEDLGNGAGVHITIAKWLTPDGAWVNGSGITPDIKVSLDPKDSRDLQLEKAILKLVK